jgi:indolepyruvate ferredoxin oxidoreductase, beta subunit
VPAEPTPGPRATAPVEVPPIKILIAALGGEGGGVLTAWMHAAAIASGHLVQSTHIPGVAQRTGATTYYLEVVPAAGNGSGGMRPILALNAVPGEVDLVVASELLECARAIHAGFVTPDRTLLLASSSRRYTIEEKAAMGDGRLDAARLLEVVRRFSRRALIADFAGVAGQAQAPLNAVLLGAIAACGAVPIEAEAWRAAIRGEGKAVDANLRGFDAGLAFFAAPPPGAPADPGSSPPRSSEEFAEFPAEARAVLEEGMRRLIAYQGASYAAQYLARVSARAGRPGADGPFVRELARFLALRMSVEDVIFVAERKLSGARLRRVRSESRARPGDIVDVSEYMRPGVEELCSLLPPRLGHWVLGHVRGGRSWPLKLRTTRFSGFVRLRLLAALRPWRPRTLGFARENAWVERWLGLVDRTLAVCPLAAREVVATAGLVRGYAETYRRGLTSWKRIVEGVVEPMLSGALPRAHFADAVMQARIAASKDPEGAALEETIAAIWRMDA